MQEPKAQLSRDDGVALLVVLWVVALLSITAALLFSRTSLELDMAANWRGMRVAEELSREGVVRAIELLMDDPNDYDWIGDRWCEGASFEDVRGSCTVEISDEGSRIDINSAPLSILRELPSATEEQVQALADWRDVDGLERPGGAEEPYYAANGGHCGNRLFASVQELALVKGFKESYSTIAPHVTCNLMTNPNTASIEAFDSLLYNLGIDEYISQRATNQLLVYRDSGGGEITSITTLRSILTSLTDDEFGLLLGSIRLDERINANLASRETIRAIVAGLGLQPVVADSILSQRRSSPFRGWSISPSGLLSDDERQWLNRYMGCETRVFIIESTSITAEGFTDVLRVIVRRERTDSGGWDLRVLKWRLPGDAR